MESKKLALLCRELAENKKAENIVVATGTSHPHLRAIVEEISGRLRDEHDLRPARSEGSLGGTWVVLDFFDVIVHVMQAETRKQYDLEGLWGDAKAIKPAKPKPRKKKAARLN